MATGEKSPSGLIFEALCLRARSTTKVAKTMTRQELQDATGLAPGALMDALKVVCGPQYDQAQRVRFVDGDANQITLGASWLSRCDDTDRKA